MSDPTPDTERRYPWDRWCSVCQNDDHDIRDHNLVTGGADPPTPDFSPEVIAPPCCSHGSHRHMTYFCSIESDQGHGCIDCGCENTEWAKTSDGVRAMAVRRV